MDTLDIVLASDDGYAANLAAMVVSLCENVKNHSLRIHILDGGMCRQNLDKIYALQERYRNLTLVRHDAGNNVLREKLQGQAQELYQPTSLTSYARLLLGDFLSEDIQYALYLDADGIVLRDVGPLFEQGTAGHPIAAVQDIREAQVRMQLGLEKNTPYLCAGMMLFNMDICRKERIFERFKQLIADRNGQVLDMDQGVVNCVLNGDFMALPPKYNCMTPFFFVTAEQLRQTGGWDTYYSQEELEEAVKAPVFVHFTQGNTTRPWQVHCRHPLRGEYLKYRALTPFPLEKMEPDKRRIYVKVFEWLFYHLPYGAYKKVADMIFKLCGKGT